MSKTKYTASDVVFVEKPTHGNFRDIEGQVFGKWTALGYAGLRQHGVKKFATWWCNCECGTIDRILAGSLTRSLSKSCGCHKAELVRKARTIHGMSKTDVHNIYCTARERCNNPNNENYHRYGGRGIEFRFDSFQEFIDDIGPRPSKKHTVDRILNSGHYEEGNVAWKTMAEQCRNRRSNRNITIDGVTKCILDWAIHFGTRDVYSFRSGKYGGWCDYCSVTIPKGAGICQHKKAKKPKEVA